MLGTGVGSGATRPRPPDHGRAGRDGGWKPRHGRVLGDAIGNTLTCIALVQGYGLTVVGDGDLWVWFIDRDGRNLTIGAEETLAAARMAAEAAAYLLAQLGGNLGG